ncbi:uncharacterized protein LOC132055616 isoform X1 [Lycium ferocissimum]|uniref:uncharacterized protein LOC132055616 isoform X1 n=1 Tax=Lycium ferocissimum TaxID=112874 RepID=UPI002814F2EF|nr:uncharacterized protein LOC132055616 isoform X1 [Lycium ferocissimum]
MTEEEWLKAAIMDDTMVAELLLRLNPSTKSKKKGLPSLEWTVRQRRSRPASVNAKKPVTRASPTTPLSWSGATSVSGGGGGSRGGVDGGYEESSEPPPLKSTSSNTRSKVNSTSDVATTNKRSRKKKTLTELKEEEILLIKERKQLKKELAIVHASLEKQRDTNQNLKRMKVKWLDLHPQQANERDTIVAYDGSSSQFQQVALPSNPAIPIAVLPSSLEEKQDVATLESKFVLPDLNIPFGEDSSAEILCGVN